ncbi:hypothetical protein D3C72_2263760 [compost metagenome]
MFEIWERDIVLLRIRGAARPRESCHKGVGTLERGAWAALVQVGPFRRSLVSVAYPRGGAFVSETSDGMSGYRGIRE